MEHVRVPYGSGSDPIGIDVVALGRGVLSTENRGYIIPMERGSTHQKRRRRFGRRCHPFGEGRIIARAGTVYEPG